MKHLSRPRRRLSTFIATCILLSGSLALHAEIPQAAKNDPRYQLGYLVVTYYDGVRSDGGGDSLAGLQEAVDDAYKNRLVAFFPEGVYTISDTLRCDDYHVATSAKSGSTERRTLADNPFDTKGFVLVGSGLGNRPVIRLANNPAKNFDNVSVPRPVVLYRIYESLVYDPVSYPNNGNPPKRLPPDSDPLGAPDGYKVDSSFLFNSEFRNIDIDCNDHSGAIGLSFPAAQGSHIIDVKVDARGAYGGIFGIPGRNAGCVNVEIVGGRIGMTLGDAGTTVIGSRFINQTQVAIVPDGGVPHNLIGCEFKKAQPPLIQTETGRGTGNRTYALVDSSIEITGAGSTNPVIDNNAGRNLYLRNVYFKGGQNLIKSKNLSPITAGGGWTRVREYSHTDQRTSGKDIFRTTSLVNGTRNSQAERVRNFSNNAAAPPSDLRSQHLPTQGVPFYEGAGSPNTIVITDAPYNAVPGGGRDNRAAIQQAIDDASSGNGRVFVPKFGRNGESGPFRIRGTLTLRSNTVLFGASHAYVSEIKQDDAWAPRAVTDIVTTVNDANATTYLGHLAITAESSLYEAPFSFLHWRAGRRSQTLALRFRPSFRTDPDVAPDPYTTLRFTGNAGGKHFFFPADMHIDRSKEENVKNKGRGNRNVRIDGTREPLWLYGFNLEGGKNDGRNYDGEVRNAANIRWIGLKREGGTTLRIEDVNNFALFGAGLMREHPGQDKSYYDVEGSSNNVLFANMLVGFVKGNISAIPSNSYVFRERIDGVSNTLIRYPEGLSLYKRGEINDDAMRISGNGGGGEPPAGSPLIEFGELAVTQDGANQWHSVAFSRDFTDPVVIMGVPTYNGIDPMVMRTRNVNANGFQFQLDEWDYLDGRHSKQETIAYLALDEGTRGIGGLRFEAGKIEGVTHQWKSVRFQDSYSGYQTVLCQQASANGVAATCVRVRNVTGEGFDVRIDEEEANDGTHGEETIHYVAMAAGEGGVSGTAFQAGRKMAQNDQWSTVSLSENLGLAPLFFGQITTVNGADPCALRMRTLNSGNVELFVEEEKSLDPETNHAGEDVRWFAVGIE